MSLYTLYTPEEAARKLIFILIYAAVCFTILVWLWWRGGRNKWKR